MGNTTKENSPKKKTPRKAITKAEKLRRVSLVQEWLIEGWSTPQICDQVKNNTDWNVKSPQVKSYIKDATDELEQDLKAHGGAILAKSTRRLERLFKHSLEEVEEYPTKDTYNRPVKIHDDGTPIQPTIKSRDPRLALDVIRELNKIQRLTDIGSRATGTPEKETQRGTVKIVVRGVKPGRVSK